MADPTDAASLASAPSEQAFRTAVRAFFDETVPAALEGIEGTLERAKVYRAALADAGLAGLGYPAEYGGSPLPAQYATVFAAESNRRIPREDSVFGIGVGMALPVLRDHGSDALRRRFLARGLRGDDIWSQMYSEPGAGSDLAGITTRADLDGDEWLVNGQKVWTSGAQNSQYSILLARSDWDAPKHRGITMFVLPMDQPGVSVRPLRQMTGDAEFNEIFLDDARIPKDWVVGDINDGWRMAVALLAHERVQTGQASMNQDGTQRSKSGRVPIPVAQLVALANERGRLDDPTVRQDLARLATGERVVQWIRQRGNVHPSIGKLWRTRQGRAAADLAGRLCFASAPAWIDEGEHGDGDYFSFQILNCRGMSLGGGTDEIQRNTIGERALGLPREPGPHRDTPFRDLPHN